VAAKKVNLFSLVFLSLFFLVFSSIASGAQGRVTRPQTADGSVAPTEADERRDQITRDMAKKANIERQAALKNDTERLVKLADELKEYVDKSNENVLSLDVMKKAEEIEKLARSVKEKMKGAN
jgi:hypothetical protein